MSDLSDEMSAVVLELLADEELGEVVTFTRDNDGAYDPSTLATASGTASTFTGYAAPVDYDSSEVDGSMVKFGDVRLYVNATSTEPASNDKVELRSKTYRVMSVRRYAVSGVNVLYELQIRV